VLLRPDVLGAGAWTWNGPGWLNVGAGSFNYGSTNATGSTVGTTCLVGNGGINVSAGKLTLTGTGSTFAGSA